ncbi:hypothetical protein BCON_0166g00240 [Botryotinia convoluta]|uniref:Uncharacterized protein n=1 Tax=Botryotinia convoluta TaxID=54673 RepID=A0A4Z1I3G1_9HELO|nr:hypothetical protein BCON_0166g00240 [Botryotinia convoluta]
MPQRTVAENRWHQAWESLKKEDANENKLDPTRTGYLYILQDIHNLATEKKAVCIQKAWKYKNNNGTTVVIRDLFEKIIVWVNKVKDIGDIIVSYDPGHAALPWAAVRLLLMIAVEDSQSFGVLIEGLEQISKLIAQCKVLEDLYSQSAGDDTGFDEALLELYVAILAFESHAIQIYRKSTPSRLISAIKLPSNKLQDGLETVWVKHQRVTDCTRLIDAQHIRQFEDILNNLNNQSSAVIESLCQESSSMRTAAPVAYFYCSRNTAEPKRANPEEDLRSILEQVSSNTANLPIRKPVVEVYKNLKKENRGLPPQERLNLNETTEVLLKILQDECDPSERYSLIEFLKTIIDESANVVKVFISSRRDNDNIEDYVKKEVSEAIEKKRIVKGKPIPEEKRKIEQQITQALIDGSQGMVKGDIDSVLRKLPKLLAESYHLVYQDIMSMEEPSQKAAIMTLQVLLSMRRKLGQDEMLAAVTVDIDTNEDLVSTVNELLDICRNIIIFEEEEGILRFAHLSVREFLEKRAPRDYFSIQSRELFMMNRCLYIFLYKSHYVVIPREQANETNRQNKEFTKYAAEYWPEHCKLAQPDVVTSESLKGFIGSDLDMGHSASYKEWLKSISHNRESWWGFFRMGEYHISIRELPSILAVSCKYGMKAIIVTLLPYEQVDWNAPITNVGGYMYYPLVYAAKEGYDTIVRQFLGRCSGHYSKGGPGNEILFMGLGEAIQVSHIEAAKTLLDYGMINVNDPLTENLICLYDSHSLLNIAVRSNLEGMVKLLLHYGADPNYALCSFGADIMAKDSSGATLIHFLAKGDPKYWLFGNYEGTIWYLIQKGVDIAAIDNSQCTALHVAVCRNNDLDEILPVLVDAGTPINAQYSEGDTALIILAKNWREDNPDDCVKFLLSQGADHSIVNNNGLTALDIAKKASEELQPEDYKQRAYKSIIKHLTMASQDKSLEGMQGLSADDSQTPIRW